MIAKLVHNEDLEFSNNFKSICEQNDISYEIYDMRYTADKKKGFKIKGAFSARLDPFIGIYRDDGTHLKGFYSEANECTLSNFKEFIYAQNTSIR